MPNRMIALVLGMIAFLAAPTASMAARPSFDCAKASTALEKLLCSHDGLARQDWAMAQAYRTAMAGLEGEAAQTLRAEQRTWARARAVTCPNIGADPAKDAVCLADVYAARIAELTPAVERDLAMFPGANVQADRRSALVCLRFDQVLEAKQAAALESYVTSAGGETLAARAVGDELCVTGLPHGGAATLTVRAGLRGESSVLRADVTQTADIPNRPRRVAFPSSGLILPRIDAAGLPIEAINMDVARVLLLRVDDSRVIEGLKRGLIDQQISYSDVGQVVSRIGKNVWAGEIETGGEQNVAKRVAIPLAEVMPDLQPGVYLAVAEDPEQEIGDGWWAASQWFMVSDIGLTAFVGNDGLAVAARALSTGKPAPQTRVALISAGGKVLQEAQTDADGIARIPAGFLRGKEDAAAKAVYAYGAAGDFVYLDLERAPLDLSDRGVDGREAPGALDAYLTTERGIYRPGGLVHLTALLRDAAAKAVTGLPLTLKIHRHDGLEVSSQQISDKGAGGYTARVAIPETAPTGMWRATVHADPKGAAIGAVRFLVDDFVPPRLEAKIQAGRTDNSVAIEVNAAYLYGAPGANLAAEATLTVQVAKTPVPGAEGYVFGLSEEEAPRAYRPSFEPFETDEAGNGYVSLDLGDVPATSYPLEAVARAGIFDVGGRPLSVTAKTPLGNLPLLVGVKPLFEDGGIKEGGIAAFDIAAFSADGEPIDRTLAYRIVKEEQEYIWFQDGGRWDYQIQYLDRDVIAVGTVQAKAGAPARIAERFGNWGGYRLEALDEATGAATSVRFHAGWWGAATAGEEPAPDKVKITMPPGPFAPGDTVKVIIEPPFAAEVMASVVDGRLRDVVTASIPETGGELTLTLPADGAGGAYILVNAFAPAQGDRSLTPRRAIGAGWAPYDARPHTLAVTMTAPAEIQPEGTVDVRLAVGDGADQTYVTLAAVDDGVLGLTGYKAPDPKLHYLGKRRLGVAIRDVYGRFIDAAGAEIGRVRSGGDDAERPNNALANLPKKSARVVAVFSGIVETDAAGVAVIPLAIPEFSGRLRLMAQAWTGTGVGSAEATMLIRRPVIATLALPRFLAPGDAASVAVSLRNLSGPEGSYAATLTTRNGIGSPADATLRANLKPGGPAADIRFDIAGIAPGDARVRLDVTGPGGIAFTLEENLSVRPASPVETRSYASVIAPGGALTVPRNAMAGLYKETASIIGGLNPLPDLDLPNILTRLSRYPYGCAEQTTSTAAPLLYAADVAASMGIRGALEPMQGVELGIARLLGMQTYTGGIGFWDSQFEASPWITAYAGDFLVSAAAAGAAVPDEPLARMLARLSELVDSGNWNRDNIPAAAYALYVRAKAGVADAARVRRFADTLGESDATELTLALIGGALAKVGDGAKADAMFQRAIRTTIGLDPGARYETYGSPVRDRAALLAILAEARLLPWQELDAVARSLSVMVRERRWLSTQEQAWVVRAGAQLSTAASDDGFALEVDGVRIAGADARLYRTAAGGATLPTLRNLGSNPVNGIVTITAAPIAPPPAADAGFAIQRLLYSRTGELLDPAAIRQSDLVVVVLLGRQTGEGRSRAILVDYLPAGFELENARLGGDNLGEYGWLGQVTTPEHVDLRDDRFVAAFDAQKDAEFRVAYLARAVTTGRFAHGGAQIEDMYQPEQFGRTNGTTVVIQP